VLSADITRSAPLEDAHTLVREVAPYRDRGLVAVGLGGEEAHYPNEPFAPAFREARAAGLGSVPHAGEVVGPESVRSALDLLEPDRIRHGFRAIEDPGLVRELADRGLVLDVTPISNVRTGAVSSLEHHPLPELVRAGVRCSVSTDDPVMFDTDLTREYEAAEGLGLDARQLYESALTGALCDEETRSRLAAVAARYWESATAEPS
jgi:aminodeoxyfutalosine deaminase